MKKDMKIENRKKSGFLKRFEAYILDILICGMITSVIFSGLDLIFDFKDTVSKQYDAEMKEVIKEYQEGLENGEVPTEEEKDETKEETSEETKEEVKTPMTDEEYLNKITKISEKYYVDLYIEAVPETLISLVVGILYFALFAFYSKGQTLGKRFLNIRVVDKNGNVPSFNQLLLRSVVFTGYYATVIELILVFVSKNSFYGVASTLDTISASVMLISVVLVLLDNSKRGLHDMIAGTSVVIDEI